MTTAPAAPEAAPVHESFVGREDELARLDRALERALAGAGSFVLITGEAGIGKSALAGEFLRRARQRQPDLTLVRGRCVEQYGPGEAYLPFLDALGTLLLGRGREPTAALLQRYAPTWCLQLPAMAGSLDAQEALRRQTIGATRERMLREMGDLLEAAAGQSLLVGLMEDAQWADPSTLDLARHLLNRIARQRMLILLTLRPEELEAERPKQKAFVLDLRVHEHCQEVALGPLGAGEVAGYLAARFAPHDFPADLAPRLRQRTDGHPLFVASLAQFLVESGDIRRVDGRWQLARDPAQGEIQAPESVRSMLRRKLDALSEQDRQTLEVASVMGRGFLSNVLAELISADELQLEERLLRLERAQRLVERTGEEELPDGSVTTGWRFVHALDQELLYDGLGAQKRALVHRQVAQRLAQHHAGQAARIAGQLALHCERGRDFDSAIRHLAQAGDNAAAVFASGEARAHYDRALLLALKLPEAARPARAADLLQRRGAVNLALGHFDLALGDFTSMLERARALESPELECAALRGLCNALFFSQRIEEMAVRAEQALTLAERTGSELLRVEATLLVGQILQEQGQLAECRELLDEALATARGLGHKHVLLALLTYRGCLDYWRSEFAPAEALLGEALALASELRDGWLMLICLQFLGLARGNLGRMTQALATLQEGLAMGRRNGDRFWVPGLASHVGWIHRELRDLPGAIEQDLEGLRSARENGVAQAEGNAMLNLCLDHVLAGQAGEAHRVLDELEALRSRGRWFGWLHGLRLDAARSELAILEERPEEAREAAGRLLAEATPKEAWTYVVTARQALAEAARARGDLAEAETQLTTALGLLARRAAPLAEWRLRAALGRVRLAAGDLPAARLEFASAASLVRRVAASVEDGPLRAGFLAAPAVQEVLLAAGPDGDARTG